MSLVDLEDLRVDYSHNIVPGQNALEAHSEFNRREIARNISVPTDDVKIKQRLRELGEPIILFGEGIADRRDRLRYILSTSSQDVTMRESELEEDGEEEFYTSGSAELLETRRWLAQYSTRRSQARIAYQKLEASTPPSKFLPHRNAINKQLKSYVSQGSQVASERPVSMARYSPNSKLIVTGSWGGECRLFAAADLSEIRRFTGHSDKVGGVAWHPQATLSQSETSLNFISGGGEGSVCLWNLEDEKPMSTMVGHAARVARVDMHSSGKYCGSASFDGTWRLWDLETRQELLLQEGHSHEVYSLSFQTDGALAVSGGLDAIGRVWDLRSGKTIMVLDGHMRAIQGLDFSPNGYEIISGSADDTIKIWDVRKVALKHTIAAHRSLVSDVRFFKSDELQLDTKMKDPVDTDSSQTPAQAEFNSSGTYLASSGYDGAVNIFSADDWGLVKSLVGPAEKKVMSVDIAKDGHSICSTGFDRTLRLWASDR